MYLLLLTVFLLPHAAAAADAPPAPAPAVSFAVTSSDEGVAEYAAMVIDLPLGGLSFGRPRSALDDPAFTAPGLALTLARSQASSAAIEDRLGPGLLFSSDPFHGVTLSGSLHQTTGLSSGELVAVTGRYEAEELKRIGRIAFYGGAEAGPGEDVFRLGTSLTRGRATAGLDLTAEGGASRRRVSGVYLGVEITEGLSLGMSREVERDPDGAELPARLGIGAAVDFGAGQVVSGAIGDVGGDTPTIGLMLGLQF
ncbi:hypothetical protein GQ651_05335 [Alphaproteobacteria bacterium GH1-50]|uniref:Cellulose biosynthesis protein BcsS n=1 Tax=Kangsaoukella pontilimi TaxID=2691042 RepID=A0A7C9IF39_9RHOB|nr:hypothetical protein [Kangsaoukella pontilimi]MXQ07264.1 hypothetical protein [Kangsaoukella pontilimi]